MERINSLLWGIFCALALLFSGLAIFSAVSSYRVAKSEVDRLVPGGQLLPYYDSDAVLYTRVVQEVVRPANLWRAPNIPFEGGAEGRPFHFSQVMVWFLTILSGLGLFFTGGNWIEATSLACYFSGPMLFVLSLFSMVLYFWKFKLSPFLGSIILVGWGSSLAIQECFLPGRPDHHGLYAILVFFGVGSFFLSFFREQRALLWVSGVALGLLLGPGLLLGLPIFLLLLFSWALGATFSRFYYRERLVSFRFPIVLWTGVMASTMAVVYGVTFFPGPWPLVFEVANPFWILSVAAAGFVGLWGFTCLEGKPYPVNYRFPLLFSVLSVALTVVAFFMVGRETLVFLDPNYQQFLALVSDLQVSDFIPLFLRTGFAVFLTFFLLLGLVLKGRLSMQFLLLCLVLPLFVFLLYWQVSSRRIQEIAVPGFFAIAMAVLAHGVSSPRIWRVLSGSMFGAVVWAAFSCSVWIFSLSPVKDYQTSGMILGDQSQDVFSQDDLVISPASLGPLVSYYGGFKNFGSFYWESLPSLKVLQAMMISSSELDFKSLLRTSGATGLLVPKGFEDKSAWGFWGEDSSKLSEAQLASPVWSSLADSKRAKNYPWLEVLKETPWVIFYKVRKDQL